MAHTHAPAHTILVASNNAHKLQEFREIFDLSGTTTSIRLLAPKDLGLTLDPDEAASTYADNALIKARAFAGAVKNLTGLRDLSGLYVMADDSGLEVDALGGRPGIYSARYHKAAPNGDGCAALLSEMADVPDAGRSARFRCVIALIGPDDREHLFEGACEGSIGRDKRGEGGFGFDPVFVVTGDGRHMAELAPAEKHRISHRGLAGKEVAAFLSRTP
jgi:XTP/dITP diphosphohydrolase